MQKLYGVEQEELPLATIARSRSVVSSSFTCSAVNLLLSENQHSQGLF